MPAQFDSLELSIQTKLSAMSADPKWKDDRTLYIKNAIWKAVDPPYRFEATIPGKRAEWMWDAIAWEEEPDTKGFLRLNLVMESELGGREKAEEDFQRLMVARADHRLLVFDHHTENEAEETIKECMRAAQNFCGTQKGDRYLFACWIRQPQEHFAFWLRVVE